jgi:hypothetical protein
MDNRYINKVLEEINPLFAEQGFKETDGVFKNEKKAVKIEYNEDRQSYLLFAADIDEEGKQDEFAELTAWLFDDSQNENDAVSVGMDFAETLRKNMGIKVKRAATASVELPTATKGGAMKIAGFTKKVLDIYPQYKDEYKAHIAKYGNFLYLNFFAKTLVPQIKECMKENNKKSVKKLYDLLENGYIHGDKDTINAIVVSLSAAAYNDADTKNAIDNMLKDNTHFLNSFDYFVSVLPSNKKLKKVFELK